MTNERKLELTLCGMLPYGLWVYDSLNQIVKVIGVKNQTYFIENGNNYAYADIRDCKPRLYSLDKLTIEHYSEILGVDVEYLEDGKAIWQTFNPYGTIDHEYYLKIEKNDDGDFAIIEYYSVDGREKEPKIIDYLKFEKLKEINANIYDLPSDMYIEKSTI